MGPRGGRIHVTLNPEEMEGAPWEYTLRQWGSWSQVIFLNLGLFGLSALGKITAWSQPAHFYPLSKALW